MTRGRAAALISHDLHCVWVNSAAAERYGVEVDASGLLREDPAFALTRELGRCRTPWWTPGSGKPHGRPPRAEWWAWWTSR